jgi:short-subunit dehydrogenase
MDLKGKTALLTGATGGIGRAIAEALAARGAAVVVSSRKGPELEQLASSLPGGGHRIAVSDLAEEDAALKLLEAAGPVDVLVANAALPASGHLDSFTQEQLGRALRVNLESPVRMARELVPALTDRGAGHLVFVSSLAGKAPAARSSLYAATKFGLRGFALALREDLRGTGVGASVVLPGFIRDAGMFADSKAKSSPLMGTSSPEQVANGVVRAIEQDRGEVIVAPLRAKALSSFAASAPELAGRLAGSTATKMADAVASGQTDKR